MVITIVPPIELCNEPQASLQYNLVTEFALEIRQEFRFYIESWVHDCVMFSASASKAVIDLSGIN